MIDSVVNRRSLGISLVACLALGLSQCGTAQDGKSKKTPPAGVIYESNVEYGKAGDTPLLLELARPEKSNGAAPCILVIHGGGWRAGNRHQHVDAIFELARNGYVAASISYRFCPEHHFPAQIEDAKCAVRFLRSQADEYQLDPKRVGAIGFSAGAHLSMLLGTMGPDDGMEGNGGHADQPSQVQAVVAYFGPTDMLADDIPPNVIGMVDDLVGSTKDENPDARKAASPLTYVTSGDAPTLIFHGTKDPLVPHTQAFKMTDAMTKAGVPGRVDLLVGAGHGWGGADLIRTLRDSSDFFHTHLKHTPAAVRK